MNFTEYALKNRAFVYFFVFVLVVGGIYSFFTMSKLEDPEIKVKQAMVVTVYPGASAHQVELEVTDVLEKNPFVRNIIIVGASDELISQVPVHLRDKVMFYSQAEIDHHQAWPSKAGKLIHEPVYISIDKDVLRKQDAITDWSNGDMSLMQMQAVLRIIYAHEKVIGVDITGECSATLDYLSEVKDASVNNRANEELMQMILSEG